MAEGLVVLARVRDGEAEAARAAIRERWGAGTSPFARVPGTHLARLQVLRAPARRGCRGTREHVLLAADARANAASPAPAARRSNAARRSASSSDCAIEVVVASGWAAQKWSTGALCSSM